MTWCFSEEKLLCAVTIGAVLLMPAVCFGEVDTNASKAADTYLKALKLLSIAEGKALLAETDWGVDIKYPVFTEAITLFEGMFATDIPGVKGYKRLVELKAISKAGTPLIQRYILIVFKDKSSQKWKVYSFSQNTDVEKEAQEWAKELSEPRSIPVDQFSYRNYGYFSLMSGKIREAQKAFRKASELNRANPSEDATQHEFDRELEIIEKMIGK